MKRLEQASLLAVRRGANRAGDCLTAGTENMAGDKMFTNGSQPAEWV